MMPAYGIDEAQKDFSLVQRYAEFQHTSAAATVAVAFAEIVSKLTAGMDEDEFARRTAIVNFVFTGIYFLRDWAFDCVCTRQFDRKTAWMCDCFHGALRLELSECSGGEVSLKPEAVDGKALWDYYTNDLLPVVEAIRKTESSRLNLELLSSLKIRAPNKLGSRTKQGR